MAPSSGSDREKLYLLDAMALAYRAHFALISRPLVTSDGLDTSAIYGFTQSLLKLLDEHPDHIAVVFDPPDGKSFRDDLFEEYKANRPPMPEPLREAIPHIKELVEAFDIPVVEVEGMEADDVIGTLTRQAESEEVDVIIVSPDKDFRQLLTEHVSIMRPAYRGEEFERNTESSFREKYGVDPIRFIDILALLGDSSDNVPGVSGIGDKTAPKLIQEYGTVEELLDHADEITSKRVREALKTYRAEALLSKKLVTIVTDLELDLDWHQLRTTQPHLDRLAKLFDRFEFRTLMKRVLDRWGKVPEEELEAGQGMFDFGPTASVESEPEDGDFAIIRTKEELEELIDRLAERPTVDLQVDADAADAMRAELRGIAFAWEDGASYIHFPLGDGMSREDILALLAPILSDVKKVKRGYDLKVQRIALKRAGLDLIEPYEDALISHYLLAPDESHDLDRLALREFGLRIPDPDRIRREEHPGKRATFIAAQAAAALRLQAVFSERLQADRRGDIAAGIEYPLIPVLADMEMLGVRVDTDALDEISSQLAGEIGTLEEQILDMAGEEFNIGSPKQLGDILFKKLKLKPLRKTSTGQASTNERVLMQLAAEHPMPGLVLDWRRLTKLKNTYVDNLGEYVHPDTGRIHGSFNQAVAATGRLSSANPNLQNIPVRSDTGREIRRAFVPVEGMRFLAADYIQIELRILASMSEDPGLIAAFEASEDIHQATAAKMYGVSLEEVTREMRRKAKEVNFGIPYGISAYELSQRLRISRDEAKDLIDQYHRSYPNVSRLISHLVNLARQNGFVETILGRRRYIPDIQSRRHNDRSAAERIAVNMPIQGTQADMIKSAMVRIHAELKRRKLASRMILQVHDELVFEVPPDEIEELRTFVVKEMVEALPLKVPIEVDVGIGDNWLDAH